MNILMFSMDKTLLGAVKSGGDAVKRHKIYGEFCNELNIIVFCKRGFQKQQLSEKVFVWPTNSLTRWNFFCNAYKIGKQIYQDKKFNLVIGDLFSSLPAWRLKKKYKVKFLMHFHGDFWQNKKALEGLWHNYFLLIFSKFLARRADAIRVVSNGIRNKLIKAGIQKNKIHVISTPADLNQFLIYDQARVYELKQKYSSKNILFVGRLEKVKNLVWFLEVFAEIKKVYVDVRFLIAGQGSELANLKLKVKNLNLKNSIEFLGAVDYNDLTNYYHIADVFVLPSLSESFGKVLIEAGAASVPCVVSKTTGAQDIIKDDETGFLVEINNKNIFINQILKLLEDEKLAKKIGDNAQRFVKENFNSEINTQKIIKLWKKLVE